ncbi:MAG: peptide ABC transporter substrate-binding protein [Anaerolineae bacterium]|nr:peptide ABC transporter substrate-binding protein [Anaerolineae bacterium]
MFRSAHPHRLLFLILGVLLIATLACGLTQGLGSSQEEPTVALETDSKSSEESESPSGENDTVSSEEATPDSSDASSADGSSSTEDESAETTRSTSSDQIFVLPGSEPPTMDPHLSGDSTSAEYVVEIYSGLMAYDNELNLIPDVAESYEISEDGLVYTFTIRDNAVFQDGKSITAPDFKWSIERACDPATGSPTADTYLGDIVGCRDKLQGDADEVEGVVAVDDSTLAITIDEPKAFFLAKMTYPTAYVLDQENVESDPNWAFEPNGSGPFKLAKYAPDEGIILLERNENYYRDPKPILEKVAYLIDPPVNGMAAYEGDTVQAVIFTGTDFEDLSVEWVNELITALTQSLNLGPDQPISLLGAAPSDSGPGSQIIFNMPEAVGTRLSSADFAGDSSLDAFEIIGAYVPPEQENVIEQILEPYGLSGRTFDAINIGTNNLSRATDPNNPISKELVSTADLNVSYLGFNVNKPPFDDPKVRQAFNLALDKQRMVKIVFQGNVPVANGIVPPSMPGYENPNLSDFEYDPERALELIAESSYGDVTEFPEITLNISGSGGRAPQIIESIVESYKQNLGVEISVEQTPWADFLEDLNQPDPSYQLYQLGWVADYPDPQNFLEVLFHSGSSQNHGHYSNPEVDALLDEARRTQDTEERLALYQEAEQMILTDAAWVPLYFGVENWLVKPYVQGFEIPPLKIPKFQYISIAEH